jgi:hypothetical protein
MLSIKGVSQVRLRLPAALRLKERRHPRHEMRFISGADIATAAGNRSVNHAQLHSGQHDQHNDNDANDQRDDPGQDLRRRLRQLFGRECHAIGRHWSKRDHLQRDQRGRAVSAGNSHQSSGHRPADGHHKVNHHQLNYQLAIGVLAVVCGIFVRTPSVHAQDGGTTAIANPVATSTGSVSNQAVQINQGSYSQQSYGPGHQCNSSTLVFTPFYLGNDVHPEPYVRNQNFGAQVSFSVPLDFEMVQLCKELAKRKLEKERLDYALVRALKCAELYKAGFKIRDDSPFAPLCADVVPIAAVSPTSSPASPAVSAPLPPKP